MVQGNPGERPALSVRRNGEVELECPLGSLYWKGPEQEIWPYALIEYIVSTLRLARTVHAQNEGHEPELVFVHARIMGARGLILRPYSPTSIRFSLPDAAAFEGEDVVIDQPLRFDWSTFRDHLGRCAVRLLGQIYENFGLSEDEIPRELDRDTGELRFPP